MQSTQEKNLPHKSIEEDPFLKAMHEGAEKFDPATEALFRYLQARCPLSLKTWPCPCLLSHTACCCAGKEQGLNCLFKRWAALLLCLSLYPRLPHCTRAQALLMPGRAGLHSCRVFLRSWLQ